MTTHTRTPICSYSEFPLHIMLEICDKTHSYYFKKAFKISGLICGYILLYINHSGLTLNRFKHFVDSGKLSVFQTQNQTD